MKFKLKGHHWKNQTIQNGCLVSSGVVRVPVYSEDEFNSYEEAKAEWIKDPWIEGDGICVLATEIIGVGGSKTQHYTK